MTRIKVVLFDLIGTTVFEKGPVIETCFTNAFLQAGVTITADAIRQKRGMDKRDAVMSLLSTGGYPSSLTNQILDAFEIQVRKNLHSFERNPDAEIVFKWLDRTGIRRAIGSGLPRRIFDTILNGVGWSEAHFAYTGVAEEVGSGRPHPDMIIQMCRHLRVSEREVLKVGDTIADIEEGRNAGVFTIALASGTQSVEQLQKANPDALIKTLAELEKLIPDFG